MTKLLVSVRDAVEAEDAVVAGAHLIDVKEPRAGSLGAAPLEVIEDVIRTVCGRRPVSAAFGELIHFVASMGCTGQHRGAERSQPAVGPEGHPTCGQCSPHGRRSVGGFDGVGSPAPNTGLRFAKLGLAGYANRATWPSDWQQAARNLPKSAGLVAVVYADWQQAEAPPPGEVISVGRRIGCRAMLIDTFDKQGPGLVGLWSLAEVQTIITAARDAEMLTVIGGQITEPDLTALLRLTPDYIAVRGAVCTGSRTARLNPDRVRQFIRAL
jgi:dihydroneopterin aldolase